ncbi:MAG: hypothetical protein RBU37_22440 [Myxococcota bacterium]|nr:hypothetical protein [Myxococcota bacterium]
MRSTVILFALSLWLSACGDNSAARPDVIPDASDTDTNPELPVDTDVDSDPLPDEDLGDDDSNDLVDSDSADDEIDELGDLPDLEEDEDSADVPEEIDLGPCDSGERECGEFCCVQGEVCALNQRCCPLAELCGSVCCEPGSVCEGALCHLDCGDDTRCEDANGVEQCCATGEVCAAGQCFLPQTSCADFLDCPADQYCETTLNTCLPQPTGETCQSVPVGGQVLPTLVWAWDGTGAELPAYNQVMMAPMVARINDDLVPDVVFTTFCGDASAGCSYGNYGSDGVLRVVDGATGASIFDVVDPAHRLVPGAQVAIADIDHDGHVEIVGCAPNGPGGRGDLIAFNHDGSFLWRSTDERVYCGQAAPSIADLEGDGVAEVILRYTVLDGRDGSLRWHHECVGTGGWATGSHNPCDYTTTADLDGDGSQEVVGGNAAYHADGSVAFDRTADFLDGYPSIGDLDGDGSPEVVVVLSAFHPTPYAGDHYLRALRADGSDYWGPVDLNGDRAPAADVAADTVGGGGPATIANFDDDPLPEIALAGAYGYVVFEPDGSPKWSAGSFDRSSRKTGSSVFDFDGDGIAEAVYADHYWLRVYDGRNGEVRFCQCNTSATLWEYPVIADVNADGAAEIVVSSNDYAITACPTTMTEDMGLDDCVAARMAAGEIAGTHGVRVFASPTRDWVGTRPIWNQHSYHVTNISDDGSVPAPEPRNWRNPYLNNFRQNVQPGATNLPDVVVTDLSVDVRACTASMSVMFRIQNDGWSAVPAGVPATVYVVRGGVDERIGKVQTTALLLPGESELLSLPYSIPSGEAFDPVSFRVIVNDPSDGPIGELIECRPANNSGQVSGQCIFN